jgi:hypothetical protein
MKGRGQKQSRVTPYVHEYSEDFYKYINKVVKYIPGENANINSKEDLINQVVKNLIRREKLNIKISDDVNVNIKNLLDHNNIDNMQEYRRFVGSFNDIILYQNSSLFNLSGNAIWNAVDIEKTIRNIGKQVNKYEKSETIRAVIDPTETREHTIISVRGNESAGPSRPLFTENEETEKTIYEKPNVNLNRRRSTLKPNQELIDQSGLTLEEQKKGIEAMGGEGRKRRKKYVKKQ